MKHWGFYLGALLLYIFSFISGFSIGLYVFFGAILLFLLGLGKTFSLLKNTMSYLFIIVASIGIWYVTVRNIDDYYLFYPFTFFF
ncbi:hypothetical protein [Bacillus sp. MRMR6]|uniref:hypothetical protein n=1 Tax=Bacillus sp. MRMR6 TaxID=1928617 RepID=UPI00095368D3|nr:hypothetical protein [Bacillus sp. MRMR6]OLS36863.1 hypothetical protein BTR25_16860 [Bacillus sp. MRMR6]